MVNLGKLCIARKRVFLEFRHQHILKSCKCRLELCINLTSEPVHVHLNCSNVMIARPLAKPSRLELLVLLLERLRLRLLRLLLELLLLLRLLRV